jgi:protein SCO1
VSRRRGGRLRLLTAALVLAVAGCAAPEDGSRIAAVTERVNATLFGTPFELPDVTLTDQTGAPFELAARADGKVTLLFFGFTNCPDICPITMGIVARGLEQLDPAERERVLTVFVTLDPPRDGPERLAQWLGALDPSFVGLTGSQAEVDDALARLGFVMPPAAEPGADGTGHGDHGDHGSGDASDGDYDVAHPTALFVFTPDGVGRFGYGLGQTDPDGLAADLRTILAFDWASARID